MKLQYTKSILKNGVHVWKLKIIQYSSGFTIGITPLNLVKNKIESSPKCFIYCEDGYGVLLNEGGLCISFWISIAQNRLRNRKFFEESL